jgi:hypothetical protein
MQHVGLENKELEAILFQDPIMQCVSPENKELEAALSIDWFGPEKKDLDAGSSSTLENPDCDHDNDEPSTPLTPAAAASSLKKEKTGPLSRPSTRTVQTWSTRHALPGVHHATGWSSD